MLLFQSRSVYQNVLCILFSDVKGRKEPFTSMYTGVVTVHSLLQYTLESLWKKFFVNETWEVVMKRGARRRRTLYL